MENLSVKYTTVEQANAMLPTVQPKVERAAKIFEAMRLLETISVQYDDHQLTYRKEIEQKKEVHKRWLELYTIVEELASLGIVVKDLQTGLIDWYGQHEGRPIWICYRLGESTVAFWHEFTAGFESRQSVGLLKKQ